MLKIINILMSLLVIFFIYKVLSFYSSNKNISLQNYNRANIELIHKEKINNLPILTNHTSNIIEFNDSFDLEDNSDKKRSFWDLLNKK